MHAESTNASCEFCPGQLEQHWFNDPLMRSGSALAIPAVGSLVPGYLLALPLRHVPNASLLPSSERGDFADFVLSVNTCLSAVYSRPVTMFEHGGCASDPLDSSCIAHAHVHLVPGVYDLAGATPGRVEKYRSWADFIDSAPEGPYLACTDAGGTVWKFPDLRQPQFYRQVVAKCLHIADRWDYAVHPEWANIRQTYIDFSSVS
ncbi:hypothetical protein ACGFS9_30040 [Streptomyces sp. NPDC048566]|uniref:hypothetical protein n=1 Tax=Streptomyces sp. NPDC048566 TaxID=3365569 RepID=UPI00371800BA